MIKNRSIAVCIILSIVTCGIYGFIWMATLTDDINTLYGDPNATSGGMVVLLSIITCGIYAIYWAYKCGEKIDAINNVNGNYNSNNSGIIYLLLQLFAFGIVAWALMQNEVNKYANAV